MSMERTIVQKLFESKGLSEAEFSAGGSTYKCVFGKYYKDGEVIGRDEYFKAKDGADGSSTPAEDKTEDVIKSYASGDSINDISNKLGISVDDVKNAITSYRNNKKSGSKKEPAKSKPSYTPEDVENARDELINAASYGFGGTPMSQNNSKRDKEADIFDKYDVRDEDGIMDLSDEDAMSMYNELKALYEE